MRIKLAQACTRVRFMIDKLARVQTNVSLRDQHEIERTITS